MTSHHYPRISEVIETFFTVDRNLNTMFFDARSLGAETTIRSDVCIVGAGAAGITLARELADSGLEVCLLESGGFDFDPAAQSLYEGENVGAPYFPLHEARARYLGGSTNLWGGWCRPLDEIDFEVRPWMAYSGWPMAKSDLNPYYDRARPVCHLGAKGDLVQWQSTLTGMGLPPLEGSECLDTYLWQIIPSAYLCFGDLYQEELAAATKIRTYLHANAVEIDTLETGRAVRRLRLISTDGKQFWAEAKTFVLALGGIENPRLLLASNRTQPAGLGNGCDLVGRFFMEHPYINSGWVSFDEALALYVRRRLDLDDDTLAAAFGLSRECQTRETILNFAARLLPLAPDWVNAFNALKRSLKGQANTVTHAAFPSVLEDGLHGSVDTYVWRNLKTVLLNLDSVVGRAWEKLSDRSFYTGRTSEYATHLIGEQEPNLASRVMLSQTRDRFGVPKVQLDWRFTDLDKKTLVRSQEIMNAEFARLGIEHHIEDTDSESLLEKVRGSFHHIGTTRMSVSPRQGVVDPDCRVHGMDNLYIAGSSVFPTSGLSNPTLTIVALAIRLGDHLKATLTPSRTEVGSSQRAVDTVPPSL